MKRAKNGYAYSVEAGRVLTALIPSGAPDLAPEIEANARLIAAAPDYHEIARILIDLVEDCERCDGTGHEPRDADDEACHHCGGVGEVFRVGACGEIGSLRRAISKAEGRHV